MAAIEQQLSPYDPDRVHSFELSRRAIERMTADLLACALAERRRLPGLQPERADIIAAGALVLRYLMMKYGARSITVSEADLLWGIVLEARASISRRKSRFRPNRLARASALTPRESMLQ